MKLSDGEIAKKIDELFDLRPKAIEEEVLLPSDKTERTYPQFSPDGKELAFIAVSYTHL